MSSRRRLDGGDQRAEAPAWPAPGAETQPLWFLGTPVRPKLWGEDTGGELALWEAVLPRGAAPPVHSHPQAETFYVLEGDVTVWLDEHPRLLRAGDVAHAPAGAPHAFRVESDTARMLFMSIPAGIDDFVRALAEPAQWPWLQPPPDGPRVPLDRLAAVEQEHGVIRHGPPPAGEPKEER